MQWAIDNRGQSGGTPGADIDAIRAWSVTKGDPRVKVAVVDASFDSPLIHNDINYLDSAFGPFGIDPVGSNADHPELDSNAMFPWCDIPWLNLDELFTCVHGTACLGLIAAAHNGYSIDGIAPRCTFYGLKFAAEGLNPEDIRGITDSGYMAVLMYALENGVDILSISTGPPDTLAGNMPNTEAAFQLLRDSGVMVLHAAGNYGGPVEYPANLGSVYAVGATDHNDEIFDYSARDSTIDFVAPSGFAGDSTSDGCPLPGNVATWDLIDSAGIAPWGCDTIAACSEATIQHSICGFGGTSAAAPVAAGIAALVLSYRTDLLDSADPGQAVFDIMKASCIDLGADGRDDVYGWGRVDAARALIEAVFPADPVPDGKRNIQDVISVVNVAFRGRDCFSLYFGAGDMDCNGFINVQDVVKIVNMAFRGDTELPAGCKNEVDPWCCPSAELISPENGSTELPQFFDMDWYDQYWADSYRIQIDDSRDFFAPLFVDTSIGASSCFQVSGLAQNTRYYWRVITEGSDCSPQPSPAWEFTTSPSSAIYTTYENSVLIESKSFGCGEVSGAVGIYLSNAVPLSGLVVPLEIRNVSGDAYPGGSLLLSASNRLAGKLMTYSPAPSYLPEKDATGNACDGAGYATRGDFEDFDGVSPDAVMFTGIATEDTLMLEAGSDGEPGLGSPSLILTFGIPHSQGTFEIDTTCVSPANHLIYIDGLDTWNTVPIVPSFTKGVITVNGIAELAGHVSGHDTAACNASISADVIVDSSASLTLLSGRTFTATGFADTSNYGGDGSRAEIFVYGQLTIGDSTGETVTLTSDSAAAGAWHGIRVMPGGHLKVLSDVVIENAVTGITIDTAVVSDTVRNCSISNCSYSGILTFNSTVPVINNSISNVPDGEGILVMDCDPVIRANYISGCETGISVIRSSGVVRDNLIEGTGGMYGVMVNQDDELYPGLDTLKLIEDSVFGYFTQAHLQTSYKGHCFIDSCSFIADYELGGQSALCVRVNQDASVKMRTSRVRNFGYYGVYSYKSKADLGTTSNSGNNSIYSAGSVDTCEECLSWCYYVRHVQSTPSDYLKAEYNWWDANPPSATRFSGLVDRSPCLSSEPLPKLAPGYPEEVVANRPDGFEIAQNYPNPFNPSTTISFSIPISSHVSVTVYNVLGQQVNQVFAGDLPEGSHRLVWDGRNASGIPVASGVYFYTVVAGTYSEARKMVVLK